MQRRIRTLKKEATTMRMAIHRANYRKLIAAAILIGSILLISTIVFPQLLMKSFCIGEMRSRHLLSIQFLDPVNRYLLVLALHIYPATVALLKCFAVKD